MDRRTFLAASAATVAGLAGCSGGGGGQDTPTDTATPTETETETDSGGDGDGGASGGATDTTTFEIFNFKFTPDVLATDPGTEITWKNDDVVDHSVVAASFSDGATSWEFDSGTLAKGDTATHTFEEAGVYHFSCGAHGESTGCGAVLVGKSELPGETLPCTKVDYE